MAQIDISNWKEFKVGELFEITKPVPRVQSDYAKGDIPFVASGSENNGVQKYCAPLKNDVLEKGHCITVSPVDGYAFYQPNDFLGRGGAGSSINILRNSHLTKESAIFICTIIRKVCQKYSYNQMCSASKLALERIKLPINQKGEPDFEYMENYIKDIEGRLRTNLGLLKTM